MVTEIEVQIDPERVKEGDIKENSDRLKSISQAFFDAVMGSVDRIPLYK